jgi:diguanylate cyclase (GGDEF)-like protein
MRAIRLLRLSRAGSVWLYVVGLAVLAGLVFWRLASDIRPLSTPHVPWWAIALGFVVTEACVVHIEFRRSAHSFSLADVPFVFGLVFAGSDALVLGAVVGSAVVYAWRRLPPVKLAFNCAQLWLVASVAAIVLHAIAGDSGFGPRTWIGVYAAMICAGALTIACLIGAIALSEGGMRPAVVAQMLATDGIVTITNTSLAITAALVVANDARALPVLIVPVLTVFAAYRAYVSQRERHDKLEFLYEANRNLSRSFEVADALEGLLSRSLDAFRAEVAEVILLGSDGTALRTALGPGERVVMEPTDPAFALDMTRLLDRQRPVLPLRPPFASATVRAHFERHGLRHAMVAMLPGEERTIGTIMLGNRFGLARSFTGEDLRLLEALANNASVALQYDRLEQAVAKLRGLQDELHHQAFHDPLTDLPNRSLFMEEVRAALAADGHEVAVLFVDVDDFKTVNDSLGHAVGDALLVSLAGRLRGCLRPQDLVARLGGDEFAVLLPGHGDQLREARTIAARILHACDQPVQAGDELVSVHLSIGIASSRQSAGDVDQLIRNADVAMYAAKSEGKSRSEVFEPSMVDAILRRHGLKEELARALGRDELIVEYQPIVAMDTGRIASAEALVRWRHPVRGLVTPSEFVPLAEETGLIPAIGRQVLEQACWQARAWELEDPGGEPMRVHVNLSAAELRDPGLGTAIREVLAASRLPADRLVLEITETQLLDDAVASASRVQELRDIGVRIALDDFGTGYSSLSYLHSLPLDILKIAKPFVDGLAGGGRESSFVGMILELARALGLDVIAEGIETAEQAELLRGLGVGYGQGFYLARPEAAGATRVGQAALA